MQAEFPLRNNENAYLCFMGHRYNIFTQKKQEFPVMPSKNRHFHIRNTDFTKVYCTMLDDSEKSFLTSIIFT